MESLILVKKITKRESKELIKSLNISKDILDKRFNSISNEELVILYNTIKNKCLFVN